MHQKKLKKKNPKAPKRIIFKTHTYKCAYLLQNASVWLDRRWLVCRLHCTPDTTHVEDEDICRGVCYGYVGPSRVPSAIYRAWRADYGSSFDCDVCLGSESEFSHTVSGAEV